MAWRRLPEPQQRGAQLPGSGTKDGLEEAVSGRERIGHRHADLDLSPDGEPQRGIDYPATNPPERRSDIAPTTEQDQPQTWDDGVQPENHARQVDGPSTPGKPGDASEAGPGPDRQPLPEGK